MMEEHRSTRHQINVTCWWWLVTTVKSRPRRLAFWWDMVGIEPRSLRHRVYSPARVPALINHVPIWQRMLESNQLVAGSKPVAFPLRQSSTVWSGYGDLNPIERLGRTPCYRYITPAKNSHWLRSTKKSHNLRPKAIDCRHNLSIFVCWHVSPFWCPHSESNRDKLLTRQP